MTYQTKCHYEILSIPRDADAATIKKSHRRLALQHHPDKNVNKSEEEQKASAAEFKLIQAAYECLSDPIERKWYDEHREMILRGGVAASGGDDGSFLFDVVNFQFAGCYDGYGDDDQSFYGVYRMVFTEIFEGEKKGFLSEGGIDFTQMTNYHLADLSFGNSRSDWLGEVSVFYSAWESFTSCLSFAWEDVYHLDDLREAPNRRIRRLMEEDNKKKRKAAKKERVDEVIALVRFVKRRDPRVKKQRELALHEQNMKEAAKKKDAARRKEEVAAAKEEWLAQAEQNMRAQEAADLDAGRIRLADLDSDEEHDKKRGRKKKGRRKKGKKNRQTYSSDEDSNNGELQEAVDLTNDPDTNAEIDANGNEAPLDTINLGVANNETDDISAQEFDWASSREDGSSQEEESEPDSWRCECCRKDFKSEKQFDNHIKSKKHKETLKKYEKKLQKEAIGVMMNEIG